MWIGRIIGFVLGYLMLGGLFGGLLGLIAGHFFSRGMDELDENPPEEQRDIAQQTFYETVFRLMGHLAKVDGRISADEIAQAQKLMDQLGLTADHRHRAIDLFKEGSRAEFSVDDAMVHFMSKCGRHRQLRQVLLEYLFHISYADGELHRAEKESLAAVAVWLGIKGAAFERYLQMYQAQYGFTYGREVANEKEHLQDAYTALGVKSSASDRELKGAYRRLMSKHHPDELIAQGVPEDMLRLATEKSQEISSAYDLILKARTP